MPTEDAPIADTTLDKAAPAGDALTLFIPLLKIDETRQEVYGVLAEEAPDKAGEIFDYETSKPLFQAWNEVFAKATADAIGGASLGNVRAMHQPDRAVGKFTRMEYDDDGKRILVCAKIVDPVDWEKCRQGVYTGFSIGGKYAQRWQDAVSKLYRYTAQPSEGSLVDNPCIPGATFLALKLDGASELRKFVDGAPGEPAAAAAAPVAADAPANPYQVAVGDQVAVYEGGAWVLQKAAPEVTEGSALDAGNGEPPPVTPLEAAVEDLEDAAADHDPTVTVPLDAIQELHNLVVAQGARCDGIYPMAVLVEAAIDAAMGRPGQTLGLPSDPYTYVLSRMHALLVACGAHCVPVPGADAEKAEDAEDLTKAGARHSRADQGRIQAMHDHACDLGAQCKTPPAAKAESDEGEAPEKADTAADLQKAAPPPAPPLTVGEGADLTKFFTTIATQVTELEQHRASLVKATALITQLEDRIAKLEAEPAPGGPILNTAGLTPASKALGGVELGGATAPDPIALLKGWIENATDPEKRAVLEERLRIEQLKVQERGGR